VTAALVTRAGGARRSRLQAASSFGANLVRCPRPDRSGGCVNHKGEASNNPPTVARGRGEQAIPMGRNLRASYSKSTEIEQWLEALPVRRLKGDQDEAAQVEAGGGCEHDIHRHAARRARR
jgi:hypothetical protein